MIFSISRLRPNWLIVKTNYLLVSNIYMSSVNSVFGSQQTGVCILDSAAGRFCLHIKASLDRRLATLPRTAALHLPVTAESESRDSVRPWLCHTLRGGSSLTPRSIVTKCCMWVGVGEKIIHGKITLSNLKSLTVISAYRKCMYFF